MLTNVRFQFAWTTPALGFFANPLQGLGDIWFSFNAWLSPGYVLPHLVLNAGVTSRTFQVSAYTIHAVLLFLAIVMAMRSLGFQWTATLVGGWISTLLLLPCFGTPLVYPIMELQPNLAFTIAEPLAIIAVFSYLGRDHDAASLRPNWRDVSILLMLLVLSGHFLLLSPTAIALALPLFLFVGAGLLLGANSRVEIIKKLAVATLVIGILTGAGFATYILGIFKFTAARLFAPEFQNDRMTWFYVSILFQRNSCGLAGPILAVLGFAGALHASLIAQGRLRWTARSVLAFVVANMAFGAATTYYNFWKGPSPLYLEAMFWPLYAAFAAHMIFVATTQSHIFRRIIRLFPHATSESAMLVVGTTIPAVIVLASPLFIPSHTGQRGYTYPPSKPPIIRLLEERIGLTLGGPMRGHVAAFFLRSKGQTGSASWFDIYGADNRRRSAIGNDYHTIGLWYYGIPTLMEYAPTISPALFLATTRLLTRPKDRQMRSVLVLRHIDAAALATFGIRYVITDAPAPAPLQLVLADKKQKSVPLYLYEVPNAIQGAVAPGKIKIAKSFDSALGQLSRPSFKPRDTAIIMSDDAANANFDGLSRAHDVEVRLARGGYHVEAESQGRSLLVVPVQFSRCTSFKSDRLRTKSVMLMRVNALDTGILFEGKLNGKLSYFTGPFKNSRCRLEDSSDFSHLNSE